MINILRQNEEGVAEARFPDAAIAHEILARAGADTRCLAFIDPYGDTTFNQLQIPVLIEELRALQVSRLEPELTSRINSLVQFVESAFAEPHTYIKFVGD